MVRISSQYHLLIADDDQSFRETLCEIFAPHFDTCEAASGEEAIAVGRTHRFDIALLDMHMQVMTGLETLRALKRLNAVAPCILISGSVDEQLKRAATAAAAFDVLSKPVTRAQLVRTVSTALAEAYDDREILQRLCS